MSTDSLKSAYDLALERLERDGIARPDREALSDDERDAVSEIRGRATAKLAELEILHRQLLAKITEREEREEAEREYRDERRRIEERRDRDVSRLREGR